MARLDDAPISRFHVRVCLYTIGGYFCDGYILGSIGLALPLLAPQMGIGALWEGLLGASALIGIFAGAIIFGPITDAIGRQKMLLADLAVFIVASVLQLFVGGPVVLLVLRLILGIAIGADYAIGPALMSEFVPRRRRGRLLSSMNATWTVGFVVSYEARSVVTRYFGPEYELDEATAPDQAKYRELFSRKYLGRTVFAGMFWFCQVFPYFWHRYLPAQHRQGVRHRQWDARRGLYNVLLLLGAVVGWLVMDAIRRRSFVIWSFVIVGIALLILGLKPDAPLWVLLPVFLVVAFVISAAADLESVYPAEVFPTEVRASGVGIASAISRAGTAISTFVLRERDAGDGHRPDHVDSRWCGRRWSGHLRAARPGDAQHAPHRRRPCIRERSCTQVIDAIIVGLGGMGSAAAYRLARHGLRVLGVEQFQPAHDRGSSHGRSRVIRQAYAEHPSYVPLVRRSYELWREMEWESGRSLLTITGRVMIGAPDWDLVTGALRSAERWGLPHEVLDAREARRRFPTLTPADHELGVYEPDSGFVRPEESVRAHADLAERAGAELRFGERVRKWESTSDGVRVTTDQGTYAAGRLVLCGGSWMPELVPDLGVPLVVERQVMHWFKPRDDIARFQPDRHPVYLWEEDADSLFYGFPAQDGEGCVKVAFYHRPGVTTPDEVDRHVRPTEVAEIAEHLANRVPSLAGRHVTSKTCMYTMTPDHDFVVGTHPDHPRVTVAAGFSGHGFKFVPVIGEVLADLVVHGRTDHDIALFDPTRDPVRVPFTGG